MLSKGPGFVPQPPEPKGNPQTTDPQLTTQAPSKTPPITPPLSPVTLDFPSGNDEPPLPHFGRYELLEKLGGGGMGLVFRAVDTQLHRQVALKTIREGVFADGQEIGRFLNEAHAIAKLHHPNIISIYDIGKEQGHHFFTMQLASGGTLSQHLDDFAHSEPKRAVALMEKIARAVQCAHERQILHRDLKPANILLDENGEPLVSDFGLVKFLDQDQELTRAGKAMGTRPYMSPEQLTGLKENMSPASDIWSLGVILYELLTERRPFVSPSDEELSNLIKSADPPSPRQHRRQLDRDLETIVFKCLRKNPAQRYATAQQLADDLKCWLEQRPIHARPLSWPERFGRRLLATSCFSNSLKPTSGFAIFPSSSKRARQ
ncbi:MAG: serine/threonine protein kinase [Chloroflexi bacterium]|nr:serine/threonine protein kinase [Chloroflexota bacterium]